MITQELKDFIKKESEAGVSKEEIVKKLLDNGWKQEDIDEGFKTIDLDIKTNKNLNIFEKFFLLVVLIADLWFMCIQINWNYYNVNSFDHSLEHGMEMIIIFIPLLLINLILSLNFIIKRKLYGTVLFPLFLILGLFIFSDQIMIPLGLVSYQKKQSISMSQANYQIQKEQRQAINDKEKPILDSILTEFQKPQKILFADMENGDKWKYSDWKAYLILDNGYIVYLDDKPINSLSDDHKREFISWAKTNLVGKEAIFSIAYKDTDPGAQISGVEIFHCDDIDINNRDKSLIEEVRTKHGLLKDSSNLCTAIPVNINFNGESLYKKFSICSKEYTNMCR